MNAVPLLRAADPQRLQALELAFAQFNETSRQLESSWSALQERVAELTRERDAAQQARLAELAERERVADRLQTLLGALPGAALMIDADGCVRECNAGAIELLGQPLRGQAWCEVAARALPARSDSDGTPCLTDGRRLGVSRRVTADGGCVLLLTDESEAHARRSGIERQRQLSDSDQQRAQLAHQLRTPLATAVLYLSRIADGGVDALDMQRMAGKALARLVDLQQLIDQTLALARGDADTTATLRVSDLLRDAAGSTGATDRIDIHDAGDGAGVFRTRAACRHAPRRWRDVGRAGRWPRHRRGHRRAHLRTIFQHPRRRHRARPCHGPQRGARARRRTLVRARPAWCPFRTAAAAGRRHTHPAQRPARALRRPATSRNPDMTTNPDPTILIVEDDRDLAEALCDILHGAGIAACTASDGEAAWRRIGDGDIGLVLSDVQMPALDGYGLLQRIRRREPSLPVVMMTAHATIDRAVRAMREGADEYLVKPFDAARLLEVTRKFARAENTGDELVAADPASLHLLEVARRVAASDATVLVCGESGTRKEVIARYLHRHSPRAAR